MAPYGACNSSTFTHTPKAANAQNPGITRLPLPHRGVHNFSFIYLLITSRSSKLCVAGWIMIAAVMQALARTRNTRSEITGPISVDAPAEPRRRTKAETLLKTACQQTDRRTMTTTMKHGKQEHGQNNNVGIELDPAA